MDERRTDTREKIRRVALELFAEQGYEKTSLREIADRLGVTKAALYYHFKTKEAIVTSLVDDFTSAVDEIIAWGRTQPPTAATRREILRRYATLIAERPQSMMRFVQENQSTMKELSGGSGMHERMKTVASLLADSESPLVDRLRGWLAIVCMHAGTFIAADMDGTDEERRAAPLTVAEDVLCVSGAQSTAM
jgi:AcrR family transcriptional regulator